MLRPLGLALAMAFFAAPAQAQFVKLAAVPHTPEETLDALEQVLGVRPATFEGLKVAKYKLPTGGTRLTVEWDSQVRLLAAGVCLKRHYLLQRDEDTGDSQQEGRRNDFIISPMLAEVPGDAENCDGVSHWITVSRNMILQDRPLRFARHVREWLTSVSRDDFCKLVPGKLDACMKVWPVMTGDKQFRTLSQIEYFPFVGVDDGPAFSYRFTYKTGQHGSLNVLVTAGKDGVITRITGTAVAS